MLSVGGGSRVHLYLGRVDFRKSVDGLSALVMSGMKEDPYGGGYFVFCNKSRNRLKILYWDTNGFCLWYKRLEEEKFRWPKSGNDVVEISVPELEWLLRGLDIASAHKKLRYCASP